MENPLETLLTPEMRQLRQNVRNFLLPATLEEIEKERLLSLERGGLFRAMCCAECLAEKVAEEFTLT